MWTYVSERANPYVQFVREIYDLHDKHIRSYWADLKTTFQNNPLIYVNGANPTKDEDPSVHAESEEWAPQTGFQEPHAFDSEAEKAGLQVSQLQQLCEEQNPEIYQEDQVHSRQEE